MHSPLWNTRFSPALVLANTTSSAYLTAIECAKFPILPTRIVGCTVLPVVAVRPHRSAQKRED
ncbi:MAG TPA: hypothetical protein VM243_10745 [Phycisphaerae bacterium]|nr:hypothetical protein [Phycisphaerae bacterium]